VGRSLSKALKDRVSCTELAVRPWSCHGDYLRKREQHGIDALDPHLVICGLTEARVLVAGTYRFG
jgi:hypothetical protein